MLILHLLENGQRLLVVVQRLERLLDVGVPVAQAVEAMGKQINMLWQRLVELEDRVG